jgi:hypothetical protein
MKSPTSEIGVSEENVRKARTAIDERNLILHKSQTRVGIEKARAYVRAIDKILLTFRQVIEKLIPRLT